MIGSLLPPGAAFRAITGIDYFDGAGVFVGLSTLVAWAILSLAVIATRQTRGSGPVGGAVP